MSTANGRVMVVDDDVDLLETLALILESNGYQVTTATSGEEALERLDPCERPSLILLDLMMPGMNGWRLRDKLLEHPEYASIPVVVLSGDHVALRNTPPPRAARQLRKPVDLHTLLAVVEQTMGERPAGQR
jgi:CheY-like chemotaxis protein